MEAEPMRPLLHCQQPGTPTAASADQSAHFPPPPPPPPQQTDATAIDAAAGSQPVTTNDSYQQFMQSLGGSHAFPPPPPPPPPSAAAAAYSAAPTLASAVSPWMLPKRPQAPSDAQAWTSAPAQQPSQSNAQSELPATRAPVEIKFQPLRTVQQRNAFGVGQLTQPNALQPLHPTLARHRPLQLLRFVSKPAHAAKSDKEADAAFAAASSSAAAASASAAAASSAATPAQSDGVSRLDRKLQSLLCSLLEAAPTGSMRLHDLEAVVEARGGGAWEDRTTEPIATFIRRRLNSNARGPFRMQYDKHNKFNPLVSCGGAEADTAMHSSDLESSSVDGAVSSVEGAHVAAANTTAAASSSASAAAAAIDLSASASPAPPPAPPISSSSSFRSYCVLVSNIPASFHSSDLRHFFSNMVEGGRFKVFQPTHRPDDDGLDTQLAGSSSAAGAAGESSDGSKKRRFESIAASAVPSAPSSSRGGSSGAWKCMVQLRKKADVERMLQEYDRAEWVSRKGIRAGSLCRLRFVPLPRRLLRYTEAATAAASCDLTEEAAGDANTKEVIDLCDDDEQTPAPAAAAATTAAAAAAATSAPVAADPAAPSPEIDETPEEAAASREIIAAYSAGEFTAPAYLPYGLVGTPTRVIHANIAHLPTSVVQRLHLTPSTQLLNAKRFKFDYAPLSSSSSAAPRGDVDDDPASLDARARARAAAELDDQEEWDRELDQGARSGAFDSGRGLGRVGDAVSYEDAVDNPWDKGDASGLVHYTDAQRERANEGDFDERTTDMFDVEVDEGGSDGEVGALDSDVQEESEEARARRKQLAAVTMRERMAVASAESDRAASQQRSAAAAAARDRSLSWSKSSFLSRMMSKMGYEEGRGLGKRGQGIAEAIQPVNRGAARVGLGFVNEPQRSGGPHAERQFHQQLQGKLRQQRRQQHGRPKQTPRQTAAPVASTSRSIKRVF